jgi:hypothetical protein
MAKALIFCNRLGEEIIAKDASVQIEKREHDATQRALAQAKEYGEELLKRNEASSSRIDKLQEDIARLILSLISRSRIGGA